MDETLHIGIQALAMNGTTTPPDPPLRAAAFVGTAMDVRFFPAQAPTFAILCVHDRQTWQ